MNGVRCSVTSGLVLLMLVCGSARAEGFRFPDLNPFHGKKGDSRTYTAGNSSANRGRAKMPKMETPRLTRTSASRSNGPTTWQKMQHNTGQFFSSLTSWNRSPSAKSKPRQTKPKSSASPFSWLFPPKKEEPPEVRSVNDFLSLPRPEIDD